MKSKKRIQWLDFAKGLIMFIVVLCHSLLSSGSTNVEFKLIENGLMVLTMPLFFAISGFLYKPSNTWVKYKTLLYKKIGGFVLPYVICTFGYVALHMTINHNFVTNLYRIYEIPVGDLWFLYSLFFIFLIVGLMDLLHINLIIQIFISLILMVGQIYAPWQESIKGNISPLAGIGGYMICFYIGYLIKRFNLSNILKDKRIFLPISIVWILLIIMEMYITGINYNTNIFNYADIITKLLSIPVVFSLFINLRHNRFFNYFDKYGKCTMVIYLVHLPIISIAVKIFTKMSIITNPVILTLIFIILGWYVSIFICYVVDKSDTLTFIFYPRKYTDKWIKE